MTHQPTQLSGHVKGILPDAAGDDQFEAFDPLLMEPPPTEPDDGVDAAAQDENSESQASTESEVGNTLQAYLRDVRRTPLLTPSEEYELATRARQGDFQARQAMIQHNLRLVISIARSHLGRGLEMIDLIEEGNLGLMHAIGKFEPERGFRFATYASWWIRQSIGYGILHQTRLVRLPVHVVRELNHVLKARRLLEAQLIAAGHAEQSVRIEDIAQAVGKSTDEISALLKFAEKPTSLDAPVDREGVEGESVLDHVADDGSHDPEDIVLHHELELLLSSGLVALNDREREVIAARFGLDEREPETLDTIAARLRITRERIRQIQEDALLKLKHRLVCNGVRRDSVF
jgi:RNA polymerase nonessential primary-like sigma factor